ncbi:uncharacterized protein SAPINGB_P001222 [Magnusiomyces paraingens]|uniref:MATE efflux family protein n=1 Tax=Magnusiomyces paraingens TaxID=2606893 RepID=A0A5E8B571_9ASCO|nr:uncharacterized protein SAPINGB_P001222 [Saprochaete ingens]VVT46455.1 unnamed protein product [Saprochaete ingens]
MPSIPIASSRRPSEVLYSHHAFSQSPTSGNIVYGSVGRSAFADALSLSPAFSNTDSGTSPHRPFILSQRQAQILANEEADLLNQQSQNFFGTSPTSSNATLAPGAANAPGGSRNPSIVSYGALDQAFTNMTNDQDELEATLTRVATINKAWDEAVEKGQANTSYSNEIKYLLKSSGPLIVTFILQNSLTVASIFTVGHLGKSELAAVSLASMTANITGFALIQGLSTCLDTLCAQAYGAGNYELVGEYFQKCSIMIASWFAPFAILWVYSEPLFALIVAHDDPSLAPLAASYLRVVLVGVPGFIAFECGKRFVQAQGIYTASTYVLFICAPINIYLNYYLVWSPVIGVGFVGAALAVAITQWLMAILLFLYVRFVDGMRCWNGFSLNVFTNWGPMMKLAIPGVIMIEAEFFAFEILTFCASILGTTPLAAQSILITTCSFLYQIPFAVSIVASNRIANFIGASVSDNAKIAKNVVIVFGILIGIFDGTILYVFRHTIASAFSDDPEVTALFLHTIIPFMCSTFVDAPGAILGGVLRGFGRQAIGGYLNLFFYYVVALPLGMILAFKFELSLSGFWLGIFIALLSINICQFFYVQKVDWKALVQEAEERQGVEEITP